jgi:hypothetical protein
MDGAAVRAFGDGVTLTPGKGVRTKLNVIGAWAVTLAASTALFAAGAAAAPSGFDLVFEGAHTPATFDSPNGLQHEGPFRSSASFCLSGYAVDVQITGDTALRKFTCSNSGGDFTARITPLPAEHGGSGTWQIVEGTGPLASLRGKGTWTSVLVDGTPSDPASVTFHSTWQGVTDFDTAGPTIAVSKSSARKLRRPKGSYQLRLALSLRDGPGNLVTYRITVIDTRKTLAPLATKTGETSSGTVSASFRIRPTKSTRTLRLKIEATDPVGNDSALAKTLRLR